MKRIEHTFVLELELELNKVNHFRVVKARFGLKMSIHILDPTSSTNQQTRIQWENLTQKQPSNWRRKIM